eukprot:CAMPEP_0119572238 /NCGR_PEP_ID=MMETSP1352-20130426/44519_1 /TAXON_ID=265584 /ORGANISM="Stauroneis constricta, Strain CCMP1120" /LENGTH=302 /DNA_ID=CAMNT_0007621923 /DNA_START=2472 /DNA_END=3376 /DNA_ORIENTATION=+
MSSKYKYDCVAKFTIASPSMNTTITAGRSKIDERGLGWDDYALRDDVLNNGCHNDTLTFEVTIQILIEISKYKTWSPTLLFSPSRLNLFRKNKVVDITFEVTDSENNSQHIQANRSVLFMEAPAMEAIVMDGTTNKTIPTINTKPAHFRSLLEFIYSDSTAFLDGSRPLGYFQDMLNIANKFGCWRLKLTIEAKIIDDNLTDENAVSLLLFGHAHNCYMLTEDCLQTIGYNTALAFQSEHASQLFKSPELIWEIQRHVSGEYWNDGVNDKCSDMPTGRLYEEADNQKKVDDLESDLSRAELL